MHHPDAADIIEQAIRDEVVPAGLARIRVLAATDEQVALAVLDALDRHGLAVTEKPAPPA